MNTPQKELRRMSARIEMLERVNTKRIAEYRALEVENARLRAALEEYANDDNWYCSDDGFTGGWQYSFDTPDPWSGALKALGEGGEK